MKQQSYSVPRYTVRLVREKTVRYRATSPSAIVPLMRHLCCERNDREVMAVLYLDANCNVVGAEIAAVGGAGACVIDVRSLIRGAILAGAHAIILGHNHPSGDPTPSREDVAMTAAVQRACDAVGILLADHVIVCEHGENSSMLERGLLGGAS